MSGKVLLNSLGKRVLATGGKLMLSNGAGDDCCCGGGGGGTICTDVIGPFGISDYTQPTTDPLGTLMPGTYRVKYNDNAMQYGHGVGDEDYYINGLAGNGFDIVDNFAVQIVVCPSHVAGPGINGGYATKAACVAAATGQFTSFTLLIATAVNLRFQDVDYAGNNDGPPRFVICLES